MKEIFELLNRERNRTVEDLRQGKSEQLSYLQQIDKARQWLETIQRLGLENPGRYNIHTLSDTGHGYSFFHLMIDCESSDTSEWVEYKPGGEELELTPGDVLLVHKP